MSGPAGAVDLVCDAAATLDPSSLTGFSAIVAPAPAELRARRLQSGGRRIEVWERRDWGPVPGWDPAAAAISSLPSDWCGLVSYRPLGAEAMAEWILAPLAAALVRAGRPLLLRWAHDEALPVDRLFLLARSHPDLGVVVAPSHDQAPDLVAVLAAATPRLLIATGGLAEPTLRALGAAVGWERIVFGSAGGDPSWALARVDGLLAGGEDQDRVRRTTALRLLQGCSA